MNKCVICSIIAKNIISFPVYEDDKFIVFLDKRPLFLGHCLVAPKSHVITLYDLPNILIQPYFSLVQLVGKAVENATKAEGSFIAINNIVSQSIPHLHTHIVPRNPKDGLKGFFWPRYTYETEQQMLDIQTKIKQNLERLIKD